ncbi:sigma-54 dependent transcriptional regulator [Thalassotalea sp. SU-HH00458]|uniref:sigma-54 interaction domain-containing protein n=1 Tax=Thalassotalea sp. SU-HH00458 TaxID=3127657 RepID=UPI00310BB670
MYTPSVLISVSSESFVNLLSSLSLDKKFAVKQRPKLQWLNGLSENPDIAIIETNQFSQDDYEFLAEHKFFPDTDFIFLSEGMPNELLDKAVLKCAAYHYRTPIEVTHIDELLEEFFDESQLSHVASHVVKSSNLDQFGLLYGSSRVMKKLYRSVRKVATFDTSVLIVGESGVGKELVAHTLHNASERAEKPFIAVNCGALSQELASSDLFGHIKGAFTGAHHARDGYFTQAKGGTLFLDEVTEMPEELQVQLLRVLETGDYSPVGSNKVLHADVRIIAATNRDLADAVADGIFREDLYFRLAQFLLHVPPLRSRGDDIQGLAIHFLAYKNNDENLNKPISEAAIAKLSDYHWPGNVRELKYSIERAYILATDMIDADHIVLTEQQNEDNLNVPVGVPLAQVEKQAILETLEQQQGNKSDTARLLDISVKTLYNKLEKYDDSEKPQE